MDSQLLKKLQYKIKSTIKDHQIKKRLELLRKDILEYYRDRAITDEEIKTILNYLKNHPLENLLKPDHRPHKKYLKKEARFIFDPVYGMPYVDHEGKKLYFPQKITLKTQKKMYLDLVEEQLPDSPHCYVTPDFSVNEGDVLFDVGSAEANFALSNIEKASRVVLFEASETWIKPLKATFAPWKDKITIVPKYVSNFNNSSTITIDAFVKEYGSRFIPDFVKMDVEGAEMDVLNGMKECLVEHKPKLAVTTYHKKNDFEEISYFLSNLGFNIRASTGVTLINEDGLSVPYFRKALIRASVK